MTAATTGPDDANAPSSYLIEPGHLGSEPAVIVSSPDGAARVTLARRGATLLNWEVNRLGAPFDLTDGYRDQAELLAQDGVRNGVLTPFPNRVADARYTFAGHEHDLLPGRTAPRLSYHGFARELPFDLAEAVVSGSAARLTFTAPIRPGRHPGYPFSLGLAVTYTVTANELSITIRATNTGTSPAPHAAGWHPYFRLPGTVDDWTLQIPARTLVRADDALIPLDGHTAYQPLDDSPAMDFRRPRELRGLVIDACFTDLAFTDGRGAETVLSNAQTHDELRVWQRTGSMHVFTGDTLKRDRRRSIALEPVEVVTNAFNRAECAPALRLNPGETHAFHCGVRYLQRPAGRREPPARERS
jgi:aldose 1-epimerase